MPRAFRSKRKDKKLSDLTVQTSTLGVSLWNKTASHTGDVKVSHKHEELGSETGGWQGRNKG